MLSSKKTVSRQWNTFYLPALLCWLAYTSSYLGRYSYASNITPIMDAFQTTRAEAGLTTSFFFVSYGVGQIINGILCKHYPKRFIVSAALILSAALNLAIYLGVPFHLYKYLWFVNGITLSILWPTLIFMLSETISEEDLPKSAVVMSLTVPVGTLIIYGLSALFSHVNHYENTFLAAAVALIASALVWIITYPKAFPQKTGEIQTESNVSERQKLSPSLMGTIITLAIFAIGCNLVKDGINTWVPAILKENFGLTDSISILLTLVLPMLGFFSSALNALMLKKGASFIKLTGLWNLLTVVLIGAAIAIINTKLWLPFLLMFGLMSLLTHGINSLITSIAPLYMRDNINSGLLAGILNAFCYVGSTISSYGLGSIADNTGWIGVFWLLLAVCAFNVLLSFFAGKRKVK